MRTGVRSFSTSLRRVKQALYEPYIPALNAEQKKALRKVMAKNMPTYHGGLSKDIVLFLEAYRVRKATLDDRRRTLQHLTQVIQSAFGSEYSVIDRSLHLYARDYEYAPLELAVVDGSRPQGLPPNTLPLPEAYRHEALAELLQKHGYEGTFIAGDGMRNMPPREEEAEEEEGEDSGLHELILKRGPLPVTNPWPQYKPYPTIHLTYPPTLFAEHTSQATMSFFLSPPASTHTPLIRLLRAYSSAFDNLPEFITLVHLWIRSIDLPEMTPTCVALLVIGWLQHRKTLPSLQNPSDPEILMALASEGEGVWFHDPAGVSPTTWLETGFVNSLPAKLPKKLGSQLYEFLKFWSVKGDPSFASSSHYLSIREGAALPRAKHVTARTIAILNQDEKRIREGHLPTMNEEPVMWQTQPLIAQDPFVPSFNHARSMSKPACTYFQYYCSLSSRTLSKGHPLTTIIGKNLPLPSGNVHRNLGFERSYSTASIEGEIKSMYEASFPPPEPVLDARRLTISRVTKTIRKRFGDDYDVECFGSTRYGVGSATSDLDLVIIDRKRMKGFSPDVNLRRLPDVYDTRLVARALFIHGFINVFAIPKATVPIVKFRDPLTKLDCDLNTNDQLGLWNTQLVSQYCDLVPNLVRPMILAVKRWAKSHGLNDPSGQNGPVTFSSYALVLMVIGYLQVQGALPNLQAGLDPLKDADQGVFWMRTKKGGHVRCDTRFKTALDWNPKASLDLDEAVMGWFSFWADKHDYTTQLLSIRDGGLIKRVKKNKAKKKLKKKQREDIPLREELEERESEDEEDAIVAAFRNQSKSEENGDAEDELRGEVEVIDIAAESEDSHDTTDHHLRDEKSVETPDAQMVESVRVTPGAVPTTVKVEVSPEEAGIEVSSQSFEQPQKWRARDLVIADPFILEKNVCQGISNSHIERFRSECRRAALLLSWGTDFEGLMGDEQPLPGAKPARGRGSKRGGRGSGGRGGRGVDSAPGGAVRASDGDRERGRNGGNGERLGERARGAVQRGGSAGRGAPDGSLRGPPTEPRRLLGT